jgi:hypothetical protein
MDGDDLVSKYFKAATINAILESAFNTITLKPTAADFARQPPSDVRANIAFDYAVDHLVYRATIYKNKRYYKNEIDVVEVQIYELHLSNDGFCYKVRWQGIICAAVQHLTQNVVFVGCWLLFVTSTTMIYAMMAPYQAPKVSFICSKRIKTNSRTRSRNSRHFLASVKTLKLTGHTTRMCREWNVLLKAQERRPNN